MRRKLDKDHLIVEQNNYLTKVVTVYIVFDLNNWLIILLRSLTPKNCLFVASSTVKYSNKGNWVYTGYGIVFDGKSEWSFGNDYARNVIIFSADKGSSFHTDNPKNNFFY